jgi:hypothetical protein
MSLQRCGLSDAGYENTQLLEHGAKAVEELTFEVDLSL